MFKCLYILYKQEISTAKRFKVQILIFFSCVLSIFIPVWRVGVNLSFFSSSQKFFSSVYPKTSKSTGKKTSVWSIMIYDWGRIWMRICGLQVIMKPIGVSYLLYPAHAGILDHIE